MELDVRPMEEGDVPLVWEVERACFSRPWSAVSLAQELTNPHAVYRTAWLGEELAGYAGMHHIVDEGYVTNIAVAPAFRRRGVGGGLLRALLVYGENRKLGMLSLEVGASNAGAIALYQGFGFVLEGRRTRYYSDPVEDGLIMTRWLQRRDPKA